MHKIRSALFMALPIVVSFSATGCDAVFDRLRKRAASRSDGPSSGLAPTAIATAVSPEAPPSTAPTATTGPVTAAPTRTTNPAAGLAPALSPAELEKTFASLDINQDGQLDGIELARCGCAEADANGNGEITKAELFAWGLVPHRVTAKTAAPRPTTPTPTSTIAPSSAPSPAPSPPKPEGDRAAGGLPLGDYRCFGLVGTQFGPRGQFKLLSATTYEVQGDGVQRYSFDPATKKITWLSGLFSDRTKFRDARFVTGKEERITMQTGKDGFFTWDCTLGGR